MPTSTSVRHRVAICETQPLVVVGLKGVLAETQDLELSSHHATIADWLMSPDVANTDILIVDKTAGADALLTSLTKLPPTQNPPRVIVWGTSLHEAEAVRLLQAGARGIIRRSADLDSLLTCIRTVGEGGTWMQDAVFGVMIGSASNSRTALTPREQQVLELVEQGLKNREIATELGISAGTVKIHLKHIFEKTGIHGRHGLALSVLRQKANSEADHEPNNANSSQN
jgi:DNA-binding NarL/FixJ family response regulator